MSLRIRTTIQGVDYFLDLYENEPLNMNFSFSEIQDPTQKNSAYSQSFTIPGTKNNNQIFDFYYNLNALPVNFDPNKKFEAIITWDGYEILRGNIRLNQVTIDKDEIIYDITFYNQVGDLAANIKDKFLFDLDFSSINYNYNDTVIPFCQVDPNLVGIAGPFYPPPTYSFQDGRTWWGLYNIGYQYISGNSVNYTTTPLVQFTPFSATSSSLSYIPRRGYFDFSGTPVQDYYFKPTIQVKTLYELIVNQAGYDINSNFFNTSYFEKFYMPLKFLDETIYPVNAEKICYAFTAQTVSGTSIGVPFFMNPSTGVTCNNFNLSATTQQFILPGEYAGQYEFQVSYTLTSIASPPNSSFAQFVYSATPVTVQALRFDLVQAGETQNVSLTLTPPPYSSTTNIGFYFQYEDMEISNFSFRISNGPRFLKSGQTIDFKIEFPQDDYKQIDFITSINRYFNLVIVPNPDKPDELIIEPMIDYIGKGAVLDWTTKIDHLQPMKITPTSSFINGTYEFQFKLDQDYANQNYNKASNRIFGTRKEKLNIDYKDDVTKFDYTFGSPLDVTIVPAIPNMLTLSSFSKLNQQDSGGQIIQQFLPFKILPRLIFRGLTLPNDNYGFVGSTGLTPYQLWYHREIGTTRDEDRFTLTNRFTTYPFYYSGLSHYLNFQGYDVTGIQPAEYEFPDALDLYKIYYKEIVEDLTSQENKLFAAKIYLYPEEIKNLRFDEKILVDNTYFRINKISNYNLLEPSICDIELIKLTREYTPHPILYYDLYPCDTGGTVYHSSSDLNYNLYAYIGNYVKLFDDNINYLGCYSISGGTYNSGYTYQHFYIASAYTDSSVYVYDNCGCTGRTGFDIVQQN